MSEAISSDTIQKRTFVSIADGQMDHYAYQAPAYIPGALDYILVVYLHGMGSNYMEPFVTPSAQTVSTAITRDNQRVGLLACNYRREASWGSDAAVADITQNIRQVLEEFPYKQIVLIGTSMGGCVALNYAATAPADVKTKIAGVVSIESAGDMAALFKKTAHRDIQPAMMIAFGGIPEQVPEVYRSKSFLNNIGMVAPATKFYILSARSDRIVPPEFQKQIVDELKKRSLEVKFEEIDGQHQLPAASFYAAGLNFVLGK